MILFPTLVFAGGYKSDDCENKCTAQQACRFDSETKRYFCVNTPGCEECVPGEECKLGQDRKYKCTARF